MTTTPKAKVEHELIPVHEKISDADKEKLLSSLNISFKDLPKITIDDPAIADLMLKVGDIIKITRASRTAKETVFYRGVINA